jgi:hypothetical protein
MKIKYNMSCLGNFLRLSAKPSLQLVLLVVFFQFFGLPSISRFQAREVMVVASRENTGGIDTPAVTIVARNPKSHLGWKVSNDKFSIKSYCENSTRIDDCIMLNTFNQTEVFKDVILGFTEKQSLLKDKDIWTDDFTNSWIGRTYTLDIKHKIGPKYETSQLFVALSSDLHYTIYLHDLSYFVASDNAFGLPRITLTIFPNETRSTFYKITLTEMEKLDFPEDPCNLDREYHFQTCIKESLSRQVGCRTKWDRWSQARWPLCTTMDQYR